MNKNILTIKQHGKDFFTKGHQRSLEAKKNIFGLFVIKGTSIAINLILVPLTINYINPTQYGIWLTLSSIITWFTFFDIGFGNGLRNKFAEARASGNHKDARIYLSTTYAVLIIIFITVWVLFFIINHFISWSTILNAPAEMSEELSTLAIIVFSFFCLQIILSTLTTLLIADQKPAKSALINTLGQLLILIVIAILTKTTHGSLLYLGFVLGCSPIIVLVLASIWFYRTYYISFTPSIKYVNFKYARDIMKLGYKFFIIQISVIVIYQTSNIIIAQVRSPEDVAIYNVAYKYFSIAYLLFGIVIAPFWSAFTDAYIRTDYDWMKDTLKKLQKVALVFVGFILVLLVVSPIAYHFWIGKVIKIDFSISVLIAVYFVCTIYHALFIYILNGIGKIKFQLIVSIFGACFSVPLALILGRLFGIHGVIIGTIFFDFLILLFAPYQVHLLLNKKASGIWNE
jgi:O-antigen/teichoic acid export membrane protein